MTAHEAKSAIKNKRQTTFFIFISFFSLGCHRVVCNVGYSIYNIRAWSRFCHSFHSVKAFALPCQSKRATGTLHGVYYIQPSLASDDFYRLLLIMANYILTLTWGLQRCFVIDQQLRVCEVLTLSKPKRTVTPFMYICPFFASTLPRGLSANS